MQRGRPSAEAGGNATRTTGAVLTIEACIANDRRRSPVFQSESLELLIDGARINRRSIAMLRTLAVALCLAVAGCRAPGSLLHIPNGGLLDLSARGETEALRRQVEKDPFPSAATALKRVDLNLQ